MIVEDQVLIGMSLEASLEEAGFGVAGAAMSKAQADDGVVNDAPGKNGLGVSAHTRATSKIRP